MSSSVASSSALQLRQANGSSYHSYTSDLPLNDALPYFDREIETQPGLQSRVEREIQNELGKTPKVDDSRLPPPLEVFQVSLGLYSRCLCAIADLTDAFIPLTALFQSRPELLAEVERAGKGEPLKAIDTLRFQLPAPQAGLKASEEEWTKAVDNAATQLMHQEGRLTNLELLKRYGGEYALAARAQQDPSGWAKMRLILLLYDLSQQITGVCIIFSKKLLPSNTSKRPKRSSPRRRP